MNLNPIGTPRPVVPQAPSPSRPARESTASETARPGEARSLEELLTPEERDFFARIETLGPLTYRPNALGNGTTPAAPIGQRIDVRG